MALAGDTFRTFGAFLRFLRRRARLTQQELGIAVGYSTPQISLLESGSRLPDLTTIAALFVPALGIQHEPDTVQRLLTLAAQARGDTGALTLTRTVRRRLRAVEEMPERESPLPRRPARLPAPMLPLIGREQDMAAGLQQLLDPAVRLLTLIGPPGVGKTRLALQMAWELDDSFADGACLVELTSVVDSEQVVRAVAQGIGAPAGILNGDAAALLHYLNDKHLLLVVDNFEHVLPAADFVANMLAAAPRVKALVTSREALCIYGEHEYTVAPLGLPNLAALPQPKEVEHYPALALFTSRARAILPDFSINIENALAVATVCVQLDGLPLAIELAAAQIRALTPQELAAGLESQYRRRSGLSMRSHARNMPERHRTLYNAIDWSYQRLSAAEQHVFRQLGVFMGSFDAAAACDVTEGVMIRNHLQTLTAKNLIQLTSADAEPRYVLLETLREYALELLEHTGESDATRQRHAQHYLKLAEQLDAQPFAQQSSAAAMLEPDYNNLRAAITFLLDSDNNAALRMAGALESFWIMRGYLTDGRALLQDALNQSSTASADRARAMLAVASMAQIQGDAAEALRLGQECLAYYQSAGDLPRIAHALRTCGWARYDLHDRERAARCFDDALAISRQMDDQPNIAATLYSLVQIIPHQHNEALLGEYLRESEVISRQLGWAQGIAYAVYMRGTLEARAGNAQTANALFYQALEQFRMAGIQREVGWTLSALAELAWQHNQLAEARDYCEQALCIFEEQAIREGVAILTHHVGHVARRMGDLDAAHSFLSRGLQLAQELNNQHMVARCTAGLAGIALARQQRTRAAELIGAALDTINTLPAFLNPADLDEYQRIYQDATTALNTLSSLPE